jgi:hypothetical protein
MKSGVPQGRSQSRALEGMRERVVGKSSWELLSVLVRRGHTIQWSTLRTTVVYCKWMPSLCRTHTAPRVCLQMVSARECTNDAGASYINVLRLRTSTV